LFQETKIEERKRLSFGLLDFATGLLLAIIGTPVEVPVPKKVILIVGLVEFIENKNKIKIDW
jgi:hypothetical protein